MSAGQVNGTGGHAGPVRVALVGCTGVLGDIIRGTVAATSDLEVVTEVTADHVDPEVVSERVDVVVWNNADDHRLRRLLAARPGLPPILASQDDGRTAELWRLVAHRLPLGVLSPESLVDWIRTAAAGGAPTERTEGDHPWHRH